MIFEIFNLNEEIQAAVIVGDRSLMDECSFRPNKKSSNKVGDKKSMVVTKKYIGIDIGKRTCVVCIMDQKGKVLEETSYGNTIQDITEFVKRITKKYKKCSVSCESTGNMWNKTFEVLESYNIPVKLANPLKTRAIAEARIKTDKVDAKVLAHLLRADLVATCYGS